MRSEAAITGTIYTDGSRLDGLVELLAVNGWAFVAVDDTGEPTAIARGIPPSWITDIPGAEAWAVLQAALRRSPGGAIIIIIIISVIVIVIVMIMIMIIIIIRVIIMIIVIIISIIIFIIIRS